jgi:hypothetical protein
MKTFKVTTAGMMMVLLAGPTSLRAGDWDLTGFVDLSNRVFPETGRFAAQDSRASTSLVAQSEFYWQGSNDRARFSAVAFGRVDSDDGERSHTDLREANFGISADGWDINVGVNKVFWGVTESRHLVDVINQTDLVEDPDEEAKLGQPMINLNLDRDFGRFEIYVLPRFRERTFPGPSGRLRTPVPVDADAAIFESTDGKRHTDVSLRYSHYFGNLDIGAYVFDGTSREPGFELADDMTSLAPVYEQMQQIGVDAQLTRDSWLWKLEAIRRDANSDSFVAAVTGVEYTLFGVRGSAADVGLLFEYLYDGRAFSAPPTAFENDIFLGSRVALNDVGDTSVLAGAIVDVDTRESFLNIEAERRLGDRLKLDLKLRMFGNAHPSSATHSLESDDYLQLAVSWYY